MNKFLPLILILFLWSATIQAQTKQKNTSSKNTSNPTWVKNIPVKEVIEWRRHIHQNPELPFQEENTGKYVEQVLKSFLHIEVIRPAKASISGIRWC